MSIDEGVTPRIQTGGLVTVAFLKTRLDQGADHLGIFMPLLIDVLSEMPTESFVTVDVQEALSKKHGVSMPQNTVETLLKRASKKRYLVREAGRYKRNLSRELPRINVAGEKAQIETSQKRLGNSLLDHAKRRGIQFDSADAALDAILKFIEEEQIALLLGSPLSADEPTVGKHELSIIAEFIHDIVSRDEALESVLRGMLEGLVLYHAAFLPELSSAARHFRDFQVYFDSALVRQAIGYEGPVIQAMLRENIDLLKASGVQCFVFDKTVLEIKRILAMYEVRLGTDQGRQSLRPSPMTRHFLTQRYSPGDMREMSALLEQDIANAGFFIKAAPERIKKYTAAEEALAKRLANPDKNDEFGPRVMHDVDCAAGILTLRKGRRSASIEDVRAVFATSSQTVIRTARQWWEEDEHETGISPIVNIRAIVNVAWLKKPTVCTDFKMRELIALCAAAMRPSPETWRRFLHHLESLIESKRLTSDQATAIVVSAMSDKLLMEAEIEEDDETDIDATTLDEIIDRVKTSFSKEAEKKIQALDEEYLTKLSEAEIREQAMKQQVQQLKKTAEEERRQRELFIESKSRKWARFIGRCLQGIVTILVLLGVLAILIEEPFHGGIIGIPISLGLIIFLGLEFFGVFQHLASLRRFVEKRCISCFRRWLGGSN